MDIQSNPPVVVSPVQPAPFPAPAPKRRMHPAVIGAVVVGVLAVGYLAYAYVTDSAPFAPAGEPMASVSPSPSVGASPTLDPMAGWKTYTNTQYGFEVKLPPSWDQYRATATSHATDNGTTVPGISFATPCKSEPFAHFTIDIWPIAEYERLRAKSVAEDSPFPPVEMARSGASVYTHTHGQDGCSEAAWLAADADWQELVGTFRLLK